MVAVAMAAAAFFLGAGAGVSSSWLAELLMAAARLAFLALAAGG